MIRGYIELKRYMDRGYLTRLSKTDAGSYSYVTPGALR